MNLSAYARSTFAVVLEALFPSSAPETRWRGRTTAELVSFLPYAPAHAHENVYTLFDYRNDTVKSIIWALKYRGDPEAVSLCATFLYEAIIHELAERAPYGDFTNPMIVPVPLSRGRFRERGFNQCALLANALGAIDRNNSFIIDYATLKKIRETPPQTLQQGKKEREKNLAGCFHIADREKISGKNIIVIDDVLTTGSTAQEVRATLVASGARAVLVFTVAH